MSQARALYHLQEIELAVIERRKRIKDIETLLQDNAIVQQAQAQRDEAQANLNEVLHRVKDMELQIASVANKRKATESRLYGGTVKNPKELQDMEREIESLTRRHAELDDNLLELMVERDEATEFLQLAEAEFKETSATWEAEHVDLLNEKSQLTTESDKLMLDRKQALTAVQADAMKEYNSLRASKSNRPVAVMENKSCNICGIEQNSSIISAVNKDDSLVKCHNCGRILVRL